MALLERFHIAGLLPVEIPEGVAYGTTIVTHVLRGWPDLEFRKSLPDGELYTDPDVLPESKVFFERSMCQRPRR